ncbi:MULTISPECIES: phosphodiester glycosidase family protein [Psychrobacter]|uniref:phosphodiester glycosidase family protein n=1 Tax=Psychrobacter TaxID=497 RepID=UPI00146C43AC|nr:MULTISPECIES: phosphodiester glycosidase family protein [Psychrobacter]
MPRASFFPIIVVTAAAFLSGCKQDLAELVDFDDDTATCVTHTEPFAHSICTTSGDKLQLFWQNEQDKPLLTFDNVIKRLNQAKLEFAMNAGMYDENFAPIGYTVIQGREIHSLNTKDGGGNFHLLPNGVLWWDKSGRVAIEESKALGEKLKNQQIKPWFATQSGPMLVINNQIHPKFNPESTSKKPRNGAGVCKDGTIKLVISDEPVTFYEFASLFKDNLGCPNALFLDGGVASALYSPELERHDQQDMGVMIGSVSKDSRN